jgi:hypothetical protein
VNARSFTRVVAVTLAGVPIGLVIGYIPSLLVYGLVASVTQGSSQTGGWAESGAVSGVVWLASAGLIVGFLQQHALAPRNRSVWWIVALGAVWAASHVINMVLRGLPGDVDLGSILPALVVVSLVLGVVSLSLADR